MLNKSQTYQSLAIAGIAVVLVIGFGIIVTRKQKDLSTVGKLAPVMRAQTQAVGGIVRPRSDVQGRSGSSRPEPTNVSLTFRPDPNELDESKFPYGHTPLLAPETNPSTKLVFDALKGDSHRAKEVLNPYAQIEQFNLAEYRSDPKTYLEKVEPARVWQSAQPGESVPRLVAVSAKSHDVVQGESVRLQVKTLPHVPATFLTFDLGAFQNELSVITVESDEHGVATAVFTATPGSIAKARVLASSPVASGNREFTVNIRLPQQR